MSEQIDPEDTTPDSTPPDKAALDTTPPSGPGDKTGSEAARYRVKLRETETERDALAARLTTLQRREAESAVADLLAQPADLWDLGNATAAQFFTDTDELDRDGLRAAATELLKLRPLLAKPLDPEPKQWGQHSSAIGPSGGVSWGEVIGNA